ncbi:hypothetical protein [Flammeovirga agarivorans]|uniref:MarR family transcriptional regulator n=1 Tax=Flammeovirga agarivorans TaxID=2726742 RepID=A0A7X8SQ05_9BACT|nr:hypothetical protein [Flammeovirga agarivorans]NLR94290.1 hypothetical protein [Flammeovirga agarivorans]
MNDNNLTNKIIQGTMIMKDVSLQEMTKSFGLSATSHDLLNITQELERKGIVENSINDHQEIYIKLSPLGEVIACDLLDQCNS